jgi:hypothetical protein
MRPRLVHFAAVRPPARSVVRQGHAGGLGAPHAETRWLEPELPRPVRGFILDFVDADGIFEDHAVGALEVEEACA